VPCIYKLGISSARRSCHRHAPLAAAIATAAACKFYRPTDGEAGGQGAAPEAPGGARRRRRPRTGPRRRLPLGLLQFRLLLHRVLEARYLLSPHGVAAALGVEGEPPNLKPDA
jgi:hypothetical protein